MQLLALISKDLSISIKNKKFSSTAVIYLGLLGLGLVISILSAFLWKDKGYAINPKNILETFRILMILQYMLVCITPYLVWNLFSYELEGRNLRILVHSGVSFLALIINKYVASIVMILLLVILSVPMMSIVFLFGGIGIEDFSSILSVYIEYSLLMAALSMPFAIVIKNIAIYLPFAFGSFAVVITVKYLFLYLQGRSISFSEGLGLLPSLLLILLFLGISTVLLSRTERRGA